MINIDNILKERKITKKDLTKKMGFASRNSLYTILQGNPTEDNIRKLADALEVPIFRLFESDVNGYIEIRGKIYRISSKKDIEELLIII